MRKIKKYIFTAVAALSLAVLCCAEIYNIRPFGTGAYLALVFTPLPVYVIAPVYLIASGLLCTTTAEIWGYLAVCAVCAVVKIILSRFKRRAPLWAIALCALVSFCGFIYAVVIGDVTPLNVVLSLFFSLLFMLVVNTFVRPLFDFDKNVRLTEIELISGCCVLAAASLSLARPLFGNFVPVYILAAAASLIATHIKGAGAGLICAASIGCGTSLFEISPLPLAVVVIAAALSVTFSNAHRLLHAAGYLLGFTAATFLFETAFAPMNVLSALIGTAAYLLIPAKKLRALKSPSYETALATSLVSALNRQRRKTGGSIVETAEIFGRMSGVMNNACFPGADLSAYAKRLIDEVCSRCPHREGCKCCDEETMKRLVGVAIADGHTSVGGLPQNILDHCRGMAQLIALTNGFVEKNKGDEATSRALASAAGLVAEQLSGAEGIMRRFASRFTGDAEFDAVGAKKFEEELNFSGQRALGAFIMNDGGETEASVLVRGDGFDEVKALDALNKIYKKPFRFLGASESDVNGFVSARFHSGAECDITFGVSCVARDGSGKSGDSYSFTRIGANGFMMAICDGMGSGEGRASEISETALSLVENYYRAGFDSEFVLASVNRFLTLKSDEAFSAMDALVVDLSRLAGDVVKVGSPPTLIKREGKVTLFGGGALPLGALEEFAPYIERVFLALDDMIVMASDGVFDCFDSGELERLVERTATLNPQTLSRTVLDEALKKLGGVQRDDMSVICGRIYKKS